MYTLYYCPGTASFVVHWLLIELDLPHNLQVIDFAKNEQKSASYLAINPNGRVPTLMIDNQPMSEFAAICMYLADKHAANKLAPPLDSPLRTAYNQWMFYVSNTIQPSFRNWFYPDELGSADIIKPITQQKLESYFELINNHFSDGRSYLLGNQMTTADFLMTMMMRWSRNMPNPADSWPYLSAYANRMKALPSFKTVYQREGLTDWV